MIDYIENFLGLAEGSIANSDFGICCCLIILVILIFMVFKIFALWFDKLFNNK